MIRYDAVLFDNNTIDQIKNKVCWKKEINKLLAFILRFTLCSLPLFKMRIPDFYF